MLFCVMARCVFTIAISLIASSLACGQISISSIVPGSGPIGTTVAINGSGFSATPSENKVSIGLVYATVTQSTSTQITITVPAGATSDFISVVNVSQHKIAVSPREFMITFESNGDITSKSFLSPISIPLQSGVTPLKVFAVDLDVDGKVDIVTYDESPGSFHVSRNISNGTGPISSSSFAPAVIFDGYGVNGLTFADITLDGKPDLLFTSYAQGKLIVYRNTTTPGVIDVTSFQRYLDIPFTENGTDDIFVGDIDTDGKPEIIVPVYIYNYSGLVSVFKNRSVNGTLDENSFKQREDFLCPHWPVDVDLSDMDGDGIKDIVVSSAKPNQFSVLRGLSTGDSFDKNSFAPFQGYYTNAGPQRMVLSDINRDGRQDVTTLNVLSYAIALQMNAAKPGPFNETSFDKRQDYSTGWDPKDLAAGDFDGDGYMDAVAVSDQKKAAVSFFENTNVPGAPLVNTYFNGIELPADVSLAGVDVGDFNNDGRPDIVASTTSETLLIFINNSERERHAPEIKNFSPTDGNFHDEIVIKGKNFSPRATDNFVTVNGMYARVLIASDTLLKVELPFNATTGRIAVQVNGFETATSSSDFTVYQIPTITEFAPASGTAGTSVVIKGSNFNSNGEENIVRFGGMRAEVLHASADQLTVKVPVGATYEAITVQTHDLIASSSRRFIVMFDSHNRSITPNSYWNSFGIFMDHPIDAAIGDIDDDGKNDIVVCNDKGIIMTLRNISERGKLSNSSFIAAYPFFSSVDLSNIELKDLDADGKLDVIAAGYWGDIYFFKNISTPGSPSFSLQQKIHVKDRSGQFVSIVDIDGDGKPDLVGANFYGIEILKNTSIRGRMSFADPVWYRLPGEGFNLAVADMNGDNKMDIVVPNIKTDDSYMTLLSIFRNNSTPDVINETSIDKPLDLWPVMSNLELALADLDLDGKTDILSGGTVALRITQNTSSPGEFDVGSFSPAFDLKLPGTDYGSVGFGDLDGDGKPELIGGFRATNRYPLRIYKNNSTPGTLNAGSFDQGTDLANGTFASEFYKVGDLDGDGRPEIIASHFGSIDILQDPWPKPTITSFSPEAGRPGRSVTIIGRDFSDDPANNIVLFNGIPAIIVNSSYEKITVVVPNDATTGPISITVNGETSVTSKNFLVNGVTPQQIDFGPLTPSVFGSSKIALTAAATSGLPVEYVSDNNEVAKVDNNMLSIMGAGMATITARQLGNPTYDAAPESTQTLIVDRAEQVISFATLLPVQLSGESFELNGSSSSGLLVSYEISDPSIASITGSKVTMMSLGSADITATQQGDTNFKPAIPVKRMLLVLDVVMGLEGPLNDEGRIWYPNPTHGLMTLTFHPAINSPITVSLFDSFGRKLKQLTFGSDDEVNLDLAGLADGVYLVNIGCGAESVWSKVMKR